MRNERLEQSIRQLQLPIPYNTEPEAYDAVFSALSRGRSLDANDAAIELADAIAEWSEDGDIPNVVKVAVKAGLALNRDAYGLTAGKYFAAYKKLRAGGTKTRSPLSHQTAVLLLSRTRLIGYLITELQFSCTQVAIYFRSAESSLFVSYEAVQVIASALKIRPALDPFKAAELLPEADQDRASSIFTDSDLDESCVIAAEKSALWTPAHFEELKSVLRMIVRGVEAGQAENWAYIQILHWCLTVIEFYDHPASYLYEFQPRSGLWRPCHGQVAKSVG